MRRLQRKLRDLEAQLDTAKRQHQERTSTLERAVANLQREKAAAEAQGQRYLEELRAAPGSADWEAKKQELEAQVANNLQRAQNEQRWRIELGHKLTRAEQELEKAEGEVEKWQAKFVEQEKTATMFGEQAAMLELRTADSHKLSNEKFREVFDAVTAAYDRGCKERAKREVVEAERQR